MSTSYNFCNLENSQVIQGNTSPLEEESFNEFDTSLSEKSVEGNHVSKDEGQAIQGAYEEHGKHHYLAPAQSIQATIPAPPPPPPLPQDTPPLVSTSQSLQLYIPPKVHQEAEIVTIEDNSKFDSSSTTEVKRKSIVKTINLPKDFGLQLTSIVKAQERLLAIAEELKSGLVLMDDRVTENGKDLRSLFDVYKSGMEQMSDRIKGIGRNVRTVETELIKCNSMRHEANLEVLKVKIDGMASCMEDFASTLQGCKLSSELAREGLFSVGVMEARLAGMEAKMNRDASMQVNVVQQSSPPLTLSTKALATPVLPGTSKRKPPASAEITFSTPKGKRAKTNHTDAHDETEDTVDVGRKEYEGEKVMTYACRFALVKKCGKGPMKFDRKCLFATTHLSLMVSHRNISGSHGNFLLDGKTTEPDNKFQAKQYVCVKTSLNGTECGFSDAKIGQLNRHSRTVLHKEDMFILNRHCVPCGSTFSSDQDLLTHVTSARNCLKAKGSFGIDSKDLFAKGLTCKSCGVSGFADTNAVYEHTCKLNLNSDIIDDEDQNAYV